MLPWLQQTCFVNHRDRDATLRCEESDSSVSIFVGVIVTHDEFSNINLLVVVERGVQQDLQIHHRRNDAPSKI